MRAAHRFSLHLIGGLQTNKARDAVRIADVIETLDRPRLADALAAAMAKEGRRPALLIEVNTGGEAQKSGVPRDDADAFIDDCKGRFRRRAGRADVHSAARRGSAAAFHLAGGSGGAAWAEGGVDGDVGRLRDRDRMRRDAGACRDGDLWRAGVSRG